MTQKLIDADALLKWINATENMELLETIPVVIVDFLIVKINELAKSTTESKEINFDICKWENYLNDNEHEKVLYKILFNNKMTLELMPNNLGKHYLDVFDDDNFNPVKNDFHKNIFICLGLNVNDFLCDVNIKGKCPIIPVHDMGDGNV